MEKINNLEDVDENSDIIDMWTPLDFDSNENYKFVSDNDLYNLISDVVYYFVAVPVIYIISKVMFGSKRICNNSFKSCAFFRLCNDRTCNVSKENLLYRF